MYTCRLASIDYLHTSGDAVTGHVIFHVVLEASELCMGVLYLGYTMSIVKTVVLSNILALDCANNRTSVYMLYIHARKSATATRRFQSVGEARL